MPSYVVTGASKGLGFEFIRQLSSDASNTVIGLVRDTRATKAKVLAELNGRSNIHILHGDLSDFDSLKKAAEGTRKITGGDLDYLIANGGFMTPDSIFEPIGVLWDEDRAAFEEEMLTAFKTNVLGNINLFKLFLPLIQKGKVKKVIAISSGHAALDVIAKHRIRLVPPYAVTKAALNMVVAKFHGQYADEGILFMSICPGAADNHPHDDDDQKQKLVAEFLRFKEYAPHFNGPAPVASTIKDVLSVIEKSSVTGGNGGTFVSHFGNQQWL